MVVKDTNISSIITSPSRGQIFLIHKLERSFTCSLYLKQKGQEIERQAEIIRDAIRSGLNEVRLDGQQADSEISEYYYPGLAADRVGKDGYSFDGLTTGEDYTLATHINKDQYVVKITYLNDASSASQPAAETQSTA